MHHAGCFEGIKDFAISRVAHLHGSQSRKGRKDRNVWQLEDVWQYGRGWHGGLRLRRLSYP